MRESEKLVDWLVLNRFSIDNLQAFTTLYKAFPEPSRIFSLEKEDLEHVEGVQLQTLKRIKKFHARYREMAKRELEFLEMNSVQILTLEDSDYPELLKNIFDPPFVIYMKGQVAGLQQKSVAIVGSRFASATGRAAAKSLASDLAGQGILVTSGLAKGIDASAHEGAMEKGLTCAVLGCGLDICYPPENKRLYQSIPEKGILLSEYPLGTQPERFHFPRRNRIISGLSSGTVVVEAAGRSGALITSTYALEQGREVFAMPGEINAENTRGSNNLIRQGAKFVENYLDVLEALDFKYAPTQKSQVPSRISKKEEKKPEVQLSPLEEKLLALMDISKPVHVDTLIESSGLRVQEAESGLLMLELKDLIRQEPGKRFRRV